MVGDEVTSAVIGQNRHERIQRSIAARSNISIVLRQPRPMLHDAADLNTTNTLYNNCQTLQNVIRCRLQLHEAEAKYTKQRHMQGYVHLKYTDFAIDRTGRSPIGRI